MSTPEYFGKHGGIEGNASTKYVIAGEMYDRIAGADRESCLTHAYQRLGSEDIKEGAEPHSGVCVAHTGVKQAECCINKTRKHDREQLIVEQKNQSGNDDQMDHDQNR